MVLISLLFDGKSTMDHLTCVTGAVKKSRQLQAPGTWGSFQSSRWFAPQSSDFPRRDDVIFSHEKTASGNTFFFFFLPMFLSFMNSYDIFLTRQYPTIMCNLYVISYISYAVCFHQWKPWILACKNGGFPGRFSTNPNIWLRSSEETSASRTALRSSGRC